MCSGVSADGARAHDSDLVTHCFLPTGMVGVSFVSWAGNAMGAVDCAAALSGNQHFERYAGDGRRLTTFHRRNIYIMTWQVENTSEFGVWWMGLEDAVSKRIAAAVDLLATHGPALEFPHSSGILGSRHSHMRELRVQSGGRPLRIFYAFDPRRTAILLIGGDKTGKDRFYREFVNAADKLYDTYLEELRKEGLI
jgi:hypothetical protein